jgi:hypothetical protein
MMEGNRGENIAIGRPRGLLNPAKPANPEMGEMGIESLALVCRKSEEGKLWAISWRVPIGATGKRFTVVSPPGLHTKL